MKNHPPVSYEYATFAIKLIAVSAIIAVFKPFFFHDAMDGRQKGNATVAKVNALRNHVGAFHNSACDGNHACESEKVKPACKADFAHPL